MREQARYLELLYDFNATRPSEIEKREFLLKKMFGHIGEGCHMDSYSVKSIKKGFSFSFVTRVYYKRTLIENVLKEPR